MVSLVKLSKNDYEVIKYLFYCKLLLKIHSSESIFLQNYLNKLIIAFFKDGEDISDILRLKDPKEKEKFINDLLKMVFENLEYKI